MRLLGFACVRAPGVLDFLLLASGGEVGTASFPHSHVTLVREWQAKRPSSYQIPRALVYS